MHDGRPGGRAKIKRYYAGLGERRCIAEREDKLFSAPFARSSATPCRLFRVHRDRATRIFVSRPSERRQRRQLPPVLPPCAYPSPRAACRPLAREHTRALRAHVRHFSFFAFTASPLCRKPLSDSRFWVKAFPKMLHRSEASIPPPPSGCNRPRRARSTRLRWGTRITKSPLQNTEKPETLHQSPRPER